MRYTPHVAAEQTINKTFVQCERHLYNPGVPSCSQKDIVVWAENGYAQIFWSEEDIRRLNEDSVGLLELKNSKKLIADSRRVVREYWKAANLVLAEIHSITQRYELAKLFDSYIPAILNVHTYFPGTGPKMTHAAEEALGRIVKAKFGENSQQEYDLIVSPIEPDIIFKELLAWRAVAQDPTKENILRHLSEYSIMLPNTFSEEDSLNWAKRRLGEKSLPELDRMIEESRQKLAAVRKKQKPLLSQLDIHAQSIAQYVQRASIVRLDLKACWNGEVYRMLPFYSKIAEIAQCSARDIYMFYTWRDIYLLLHHDLNLPKKVLAARKKAYLIHFAGFKTRIYCGENAYKMKDRILQSSLPDKAIASLTGMPTYQGKVRGVVLTVKGDNPAEYEKLSKTITKDTILVTGMTNPAMVILLEKVKGIITDEGGVACHAAIISREFKIPCIVGTKIATHIFKDGDMVELDATKGHIERI